MAATEKTLGKQRQHNRHAGFGLLATMMFVLILTQSASAQWSFRAAANASYDDNPLAVAQATSSNVWDFEFGVDRSIKRFGFGYTANYIHYGQLSSIDAVVGNGYGSLSNDISTIGIMVDHRTSINEKLYDYVGITSVASHRFKLIGFISSAQLTGGLYQFPVLTERDRGSGSLLFNAARSLPTRTTVILGLGIGYTVYTGAFETDQQPAVVRQTASLRIAQSLTPSTGLAVQGYMRRLSGNSPSMYTIQEDSISYALLDDPSLYSIATISTELTQVLFNYALTVKLGAFHSKRDYLTQGSYLDESVYDEDEQRSDTQNSMWLSATYALQALGPDIDLKLNAQWSDNESNSYWYSYAGSYLSLGLQYNF